MAKKPNGHAVATSSNSIVSEHLAASKRVGAQVLASKKNSKAFLVKAGIASKSGTKLAKPYR